MFELASAAARQGSLRPGVGLGTPPTVFGGRRIAGEFLYRPRCHRVRPSRLPHDAREKQRESRSGPAPDHDRL
jgi:hypothetical protein